MTKGAELSANEREEGSTFAPKFDGNGLLTAVVLDEATSEVLVVAFMNATALDLTFQSGEVHFWSRSRHSIWKKGETSGNVLLVVDVMTDCDQDALVIKAKPVGPTCHTGRPSCFYRRVVKSADGGLTLVKVKT